jgi:exopolysaccharide/PEP-CTERM locus tyrosine autokinase
LSIIERVAELLGPITKSNRIPAASGKEYDGTRELDLIERAVAKGNERPEISEPGAHTSHPNVSDLAAGPKVKPGPALSARRTVRTLRVELDRLRRQGMITPDGGRTPIAEGFRRIKRQILVNMASPKAGAPASLVMVTSALPGEGKTFCAINLALSIALEKDYSVLLVDADVAKPSIPQLLGLDAGKGLMDLLVDRRIELEEVLCKIDIGKLTLLPAGTVHQHATELLASGAMRELLREMAERYQDRIIIFDSPPLLAASEAGVLANQMGQIVLVVETGKTSEAALKNALSRIETSNITGLVLNKGEVPGLEYGYGGYGYGAK